MEETKETNFTSGVGPDHIPPSNVLVSYPMVEQLNFYPKEYNQGFIQLRKGQPDLFNPGPEWKQALYFTNVDAKTNLSATLSYSASDKRISFTIPNGFQNDRLHKLEILNVPSANARLDANIQNVESKIESTGDTLTTKKIEGDLALRDAKTVYGAPFRTSRFNTFVEKMKDIRLHNTINDPAETGDLTVLRNYILGAEALEKLELEKMGEVGPITKADAVLQGNHWYESIVYPLVYQGYPLNGKFTTDRDTTEYGMPATRAGYLKQLTTAPTLDPAAQTATAPTLSGYLWYDIMRPMKADFKDIQRKIANYVADKPSLMNDRFENILTKPFPFYRQGKYYIRIRYQLPGTTQTTSSYDFELYNAVPD
ncbi:hypothetical protein [Chryseolinea lacunae]|uniref:Cell surface protein SprA n=1 Tax=Chryseolinea lacunae TaxID=2801331 RepID=A0ABS1KJM8_9BACT|nr:hypothetical protein [Chryseolinea lacunae]MBL0739668.1 hypothetical protein [Chryseolinea lacunae]